MNAIDMLIRSAQHQRDANGPICVACGGRATQWVGERHLCWADAQEALCVLERERMAALRERGR